MKRRIVFAFAAIVAVLVLAGTQRGGLIAMPPHAHARAAASAALAVLPATTTPDVYAVARVVDGDTFDALIGSTVTRIRVIGLDTPEVVDPRKPVQCFGREASAEAHSLLDGHYVRLESDPSQNPRDKYGRTLAFVFLLDGRSYEEYMIENGFGHEYTYKKPYIYQSRFRTAEAAARAAKKGFWSDATCGGDTKKAVTST